VATGPVRPSGPLRPTPPPLSVQFEIGPARFKTGRSCFQTEPARPRPRSVVFGTRPRIKGGVKIGGLAPAPPTRPSATALADCYLPCLGLVGGQKWRGGVQNHSTQDSHVVPHHGTNWAALRLTAQIGRDAVLSESYGRGYMCSFHRPIDPPLPRDTPNKRATRSAHGATAARKDTSLHRGPALKRRANKEKKKGVQPKGQTNL
jgi:hypothetical protein